MSEGWPFQPTRMHSWLHTFDKATRVLVNSDKPADLMKILKDAPFPIDWVPEDGGRKQLYKRSDEPTEEPQPRSRPGDSNGVQVTPLPKLRNRSILATAVRLGRTECVRALIAPPLFANPAAASAFDGNTSVHLCAIHGKPEALAHIFDATGTKGRAWTNKCVSSFVYSSLCTPLACIFCVCVWIPVCLPVFLHSCELSSLRTSPARVLRTCVTSLSFPA